MSWSTLVIPMMRDTTVHSRYPTSAEAIRKAEELELKDYVAVDAGTRMTVFSSMELDAMLKIFGDTRFGVPHEEKAEIARGYLSQFDPKKHGEGGIAAADAYRKPTVKSDAKVAKKAAKAAKPKAVQAAEEKAAKESKKEKAAAKGKKKLAKKVAKPRVKGKSGGDGLGREGTPARFIREAYLAGKDTDAIYEAAKKKFPDNDIKGKGYVSWYFHDMKRKGQVKGDIK